MDWFLAELVRRANEGGFRVGMTLFVGGAVVTGSLISGRAYFEALADTAAFGDPATADRARAFLRSPAAMYLPGWGDAEAAFADDELLAYIHLANARVRTGSGEVLPGSSLWRGRLAAVDGFTVGAIEAG